MSRAPLDLIDVDHLHSAEELQIRAVVRKVVDERVRPFVAEWYEQGYVPVRELAKEFGAIGLLGMHLSGYGCAGASAVAYGLACLELEAGDSGVRSLVSVQGSLAMFAIHAYGSDEHKDEWLPRMATGEALGCFGLTEPDHGSDPGSMTTRARRDGDDWILHGGKMWITNAPVADVAVVWARTDAVIGGAAAGPRPQGAAVLPVRGALRHRLGRGRRGPRVPGHRHRLRDHPHPVRQAAGRLPAHPGQARRHERRTAEGLPARAAPGAPARRRAHHPGAGQRRQAEQRTGGDRDRPAVPHDPRRQRHQRRVPGDAARQQPGERADLRGHLRGAPAGHRREPHRGFRLRLSGYHPLVVRSTLENVAPPPYPGCRRRGGSRRRSIVERHPLIGCW